ncbi:MAG TPA: hypothetical protein DEP25_04280 [Candidatus Taylorbacteria bacterium]|nr:hypothetical protein [Candidatus Taylorbacteria bacterium]
MSVKDYENRARFSEKRIIRFQNKVLDFYRKRGRVFPWRNIRDPYAILVSEVMLQQTQVPRVEIIFKRFLRSFPTLHALARASNRDVLLAWRGMGYNSRALRLRDAARCIVDRFRVTKLQVTGYSSSKAKPETCEPLSCHFPMSLEQLTAIPGIVPYTAAAILNFAFNIPTPCIDTNIRRILHRVFFGPEKKDGTFAKGDKALLMVARELLEVALHPLYPPNPLSPAFALPELRTGRPGEKGGARL